MAHFWPTTRSAGRAGNDLPDNRYAITRATRRPPPLRSPRAGQPAPQPATPHSADAVKPKEKTL